MKRGLKNIHEVGYAVEFGGKNESAYWGGDERTRDECTKIKGTDGTIMPPFRKKEDGLTFFARQLCATLHMNFKRKVSFRGVNLHAFEFKFDDLLGNNMSCFCREDNQCPVKGTLNLYPCLQAPIVISHPHFLYGDPSLLENVGTGLEPIEKLHEFIFKVELVMIVFLGSMEQFPRDSFFCFVP